MKPGKQLIKDSLIFLVEYSFFSKHNTIHPFSSKKHSHPTYSNTDTQQEGGQRMRERENESYTISYSICVSWTRSVRLLSFFLSLSTSTLHSSVLLTEAIIHRYNCLSVWDESEWEWCNDKLNRERMCLFVFESYVWIYMARNPKRRRNERNEKIEYKKSSYINYIRIICCCKS